jgi:hypothetical protein
MQCIQKGEGTMTRIRSYTISCAPFSALVTSLAAAYLLAAPAQAQRVSINDLYNNQNQGATPITACGTIDQPGSYVVVQNLNALPPTGDCLLVAADHVTIDLGGHLLSGIGGGGGVTTGGEDQTDIAVRNGTVTGFDRGIDFQFAQHSAVRHVRATDNVTFGILLSNGGTATGNTASDNGSNGIFCASGCTVSGNTARLNGGDGIRVSGGAVSGNTAWNNGDDGIDVSTGSTVSYNSMRFNGSDGLEADCPSNAVGNTATNNTSKNFNLVGTGCGNFINIAP